MAASFSPAMNGRVYAAIANLMGNTVSVYVVDQETGGFTLVGTVPAYSPRFVSFSPVINGRVYMAVTCSDDRISVYSIESIVNMEELFGDIKHAAFGAE